MFEAYMNLFDVSKNPLVGKRLEELLNIFLDQIIKQNDRTFCQLFFDELWNPKSDHISFGHDIEASWLLERAATILGNQKLLEKIRKVCVALAESVHKYGMDNKNSLFYEADSNGLVETNKD
jgi:mannobiose 2-epimerase